MSFIGGMLGGAISGAGSGSYAGREAAKEVLEEWVELTETEEQRGRRLMRLAQREKAEKLQRKREEEARRAAWVAKAEEVKAWPLAGFLAYLMLTGGFAVGSVAGVGLAHSFVTGWDDGNMTSIVSAYVGLMPLLMLFPGFMAGASFVEHIRLRRYNPATHQWPEVEA